MQKNSLMSEPKKKKKFLNLPQYTGGKKAFNEFLRSQIVYPDQALKAGVEGSVYVEYEIDDNGIVHNPKVLKGIGYGCDEEALRLVSLLRYEKVKNFGVRVKTTTKTSIHFKLPAQTTLQYTIKTTTATSTKKPETPTEVPQPVVYNYTIQF
ncbi:MAG: periplasmic protein TonB [Bacteroidetes bacterium]|nr:MAG: periplasmic protein TonB [Bacteroidota bacterium]